MTGAFLLSQAYEQASYILCAFFAASLVRENEGKVVFSTCERPVPNSPFRVKWSIGDSGFFYIDPFEYANWAGIDEDGKVTVFIDVYSDKGPIAFPDYTVKWPIDVKIVTSRSFISLQ